ncbi:MULTISPECIES: MarR family winged helix-turn-helix transcriptional regulator [unclassified Janibacter]|uniref:MarR family winged helix-turn-helix transcriptional regulator n=1 Tax=unclassified Janibacter TaxID=2649294 RepID=UPI003D05A0EA
MSPQPRPADDVDVDDVDRIVSAWRRERPDLDVSPLAVLSRVSRLARRLDQARGATFGEHSLDGWEFDVLSALRRAGRPYELSPGQLVTETLVTSGTMTNRIDRLERRGFVARRPSPTDRRGVIVRLTPAGRKAVDAALEALLDAERAILEGLPDRDRDDLAGLLRHLLATVEAP